jgi:hypothetical protein
LTRGHGVLIVVRPGPGLLAVAIVLGAWPIVISKPATGSRHR